MKETSKACVLLFSGGRDSTLAALRLSPVFETLILVTVTSAHLIGIEAVHRRLDELRSYLSPDTRWLNILQPPAVPSGRFSQVATCLPCHRSYTAIGTIIAESINTDSLAFGYTGYQSDWIEQTPCATECLKRVLACRKVKLLLPVYDIASKSDAVSELERYGFSTVALEQKCIQQQFNVALEPYRIQKEIAAWKQALIETLDDLRTIRIETLADTTLGDFSSLKLK